MATNQNNLIRKLIDTIGSSIEGFNNSIPGIQERMSDEVQAELKAIELDAKGNVKASVNNLRLIIKIKAKLTNIILDDDYIRNLKQYVNGFSEVSRIQNQYFESITKEFRPSELLNEIKTQSISSTLDSLTEKGVGINISDKVGELLQRNITTGGRYSDLVKSLNNYLLSNDKGLGVLERYTKQITTDALNQYAAQYTNAVTNDLGLEWFMYTGPLIESSRTFCEALVKKKYIHKSELPDIILGRFNEFKDMQGRISPKTKLPEGMYDGTTVANFHIYRGGYNCGHQLIPVDEAVVPDAIKRMIN